MPIDLTTIQKFEPGDIEPEHYIDICCRVCDKFDVAVPEEFYDNRFSLSDGWKKYTITGPWCITYDFVCPDCIARYERGEYQR